MLSPLSPVGFSSSLTSGSSSAFPPSPWLLHTNNFPSLLPGLMQSCHKYAVQMQQRVTQPGDSSGAILGPVSQQGCSAAELTPTASQGLLWQARQSCLGGPDGSLRRELETGGGKVAVGFAVGAGRGRGFVQ